jgi:hypothetical protein
MKSRYAYFGIATLLAGALLAAGFWLGRVSRPEGGGVLAPPRTVYVVQEFNWRFTARGDPYVLDEGAPGRPVRAFVEQGSAAAYCRDLNHQKRGVNPFRYSPEPTSGSYLDQYTTMGEDAFLALVRSEGLIPPVRDPDPSKDYHGLYGEPWVIWWDKHSEKWDDRLVERLWDALDRVRFYEVVEVALER